MRIIYQFAMSEFWLMCTRTPRHRRIRESVLNHPNTNVISLLRTACVFISLIFAVASIAQDNLRRSEWLVFVSGDYGHKSGVDNSATQVSDFTPAVDLLYSYAKDSWRFLAEYLLTDSENELERLQLGYEWSTETTTWLGRFHQPSSAWAAKYHHGRLLQTSIARPEIENWEDDGGVLPVHASGLLFEQRRHRSSGSGSEFSFTYGIGPVIEDRELVPYDFLDRKNSHVRGSTSGLTYSYFSDYVVGTSVGITGLYTEIYVDTSPALNIAAPFDIFQTVVGAQIDLRFTAWQLNSAAYYIDNSTRDPQHRFGGSFVSAYAELLHTVSEKSTIYVRAESSANAKKNGYLKLFPDFVTGKGIAGYRYDLPNNQALSIELSSESSILENYFQARVQWSAVYP